MYLLFFILVLHLFLMLLTKKRGDLSGLIYLPINVNISLFFFLLEDGSYICMGVWGRGEILKFLWHFLYRFSINSSSFQPVYYVLLIPHLDTHNYLVCASKSWALEAELKENWFTSHKHSPLWMLRLCLPPLCLVATSLPLQSSKYVLKSLVYYCFLSHSLCPCDIFFFFFFYCHFSWVWRGTVNKRQCLTRRFS